MLKQQPALSCFICSTHVSVDHKSQAQGRGHHTAARASQYQKRFDVTHMNIIFYKGALHQSRNERDGHWVLGRTLPDLKLSLLLKRHNCIELSYLDPRIVRQVRPLPGVSRTCAVMINSLENPVHMNLLEELRKRPVRLRLKRARPAAKLPPPLLECRSGQPFEELWSDR